MEWMEQSAEMMKSWTDMQKHMWQGWLDASAGLGKTEDNPLAEWVARWQETAKKSMDTWEELTRTFVESEATWAGGDAAASCFPGKEDEIKKMTASWAEQTLAVMKSWTEAQRKLWDSWFAAAADMAKSAKGPGADWSQGWQDAAKSSMDAWEDLSRRTMDTQADWFKGWQQTAADGGKKAASGKKPE